MRRRLAVRFVEIAEPRFPVRRPCAGCFRLSFASFIGADWRRIAKSRLLPTRPHGIKSMKRTGVMTANKPEQRREGRYCTLFHKIARELLPRPRGLLYAARIGTIRAASVPLALF